MKRLFPAAAAVIVIGGALPVLAQTTAAPLLTAPPMGKTINKYYKQSVYDPAKDKIGTIDDVVISDGGQIEGLIIGVGGFLGVGEKDVAVAYRAVHAEMKDNAWYLTLNTTKDALKAAPALTFDKSKTTWIAK
ncbi:MAG TPA: PRC-barrel domain-containing protein [Stellaceae bacterium]|jgi:sporulation protein YlmC with PRC-barrel domain|nr:PRC-barrel domain-containing protein [Stellaceae bacterium]